METQIALQYGSDVIVLYLSLVSYLIGVNISEQKSGTEQTEKRKKRELICFPPPGVATGTVVHRPDATPIFP